MLPRGEGGMGVSGLEEVTEFPPEAQPITVQEEPEQVPAEKPPAEKPKPEPVVTPPSEEPESRPPVATEPRSRVLIRKVRELKPNADVRTVVGIDGDAGDFRARMGAMKKLTRNLSTNDVTALRLFLDFRFDEHGKAAELRLLEFEGLKNDALTILLAQDNLPAGLGYQLAEMFRDKEHSDVWRAYCIQFIPEYYEEQWPAGSEPEPEKGQEEDPERLDMEKACWEALEDEDSTTKGTALLALEDLSGKYDRFEKGKVEEAAVAMAVDDACEEPARITSLRICGMTGRKEVLPAARMIAQTGETVTLRMAAVATLGDLGGEEDVELLESLSASKEKRIKQIAEATLTRMKSE